MAPPNAFYDTLYQNHPYSLPPEGTLETVKDITELEVKGFYQQYYMVKNAKYGKNAKVVIVGDVTRKQAESIAQEIIGSFPTGQSTEPLVPAQANTVAKYRYITFPSERNTLIGQIGIDPTNLHYFLLVLGNQILRGLHLSLILFNQVRNERGLTYGAYK